MQRIVKCDKYFGSNNVVVFDKYYRPVYEAWKNLQSSLAS